MKYVAIVALAVLGMVELVLRCICALALILTIFGWFIVEDKLDLLDCSCFKLAEKLIA